MEERRICKKCLTREIEGQEALFQTMRDYIDSLEEEIKTDNVQYEERLAVCRDCDNLLAGMCRNCGCYVEMRAAVRTNHCPWKKW